MLNNSVAVIEKKFVPSLPRPRAARRMVRILLVEDCASDVFLVERMFESVSLDCDYTIKNANRLIDAFGMIDSEMFDVIMLDLNLMDIDGVASVAALHAEVPGIPIIVYSGMDDAKLKESAFLCGATHYLVKGRESAYGLKHIIESAIGKKAA